MKVKSILSGSAFVFAALLSGSLIFPSSTSSAETLPSQAQQKVQSAQTPADSISGSLGEAVAAESVESSFIAPPTHYVATAYSLRGRTASGRPVAKGLIAADPRVLPLGSRVRLEAGNYSGEYLVADTGGGVKGKKIDIWTPNSREAMQFGRRTVKLTVLSWGGKKQAAHPVKK